PVAGFGGRLLAEVHVPRHGADGRGLREGDHGGRWERIGQRKERNGGVDAFVVEVANPREHPRIVTTGYRPVAGSEADVEILEEARGNGAVQRFAGFRRGNLGRGRELVVDLAVARGAMREDGASGETFAAVAVDRGDGGRPALPQELRFQAERPGCGPNERELGGA